MGTEREFNWILKINKLEKDILEDINTKGAGIFMKGKKDGLRDYPEEPIIAVDKNWNAFAVVEKQQKVEYSDRTTGYTFKIKRYLTLEEKNVFTNFYKEMYSK